MKTKNLKEMQEEFLQSRGQALFSPIALKNLKQEAIKHINEIQRTNPFSPTQDWIFNFFNITEEDLNDRKNK